MSFQLGRKQSIFEHFGVNLPSYDGSQETNQMQIFSVDTESIFDNLANCKAIFENLTNCKANPYN
jgi:hypothetical protein